MQIAHDVTFRRSDWTRQDPVAGTTPSTRRYQTPLRVRVGGWLARLAIPLLLHYLDTALLPTTLLLHYGYTPATPLPRYGATSHYPAVSLLHYDYTPATPLPRYRATSATVLTLPHPHL